MTPLDLLKKRHSVRTFKNVPIEKDIVNKLKAEITLINTHESGLNFQLILNDDKPFNGFFKSYGTFVNAKNYVAAVVDTDSQNAYERAGYFAQKFVIKALEIGIASCFVGGTYDPKSVDVRLRASEKILCLIVLGYPLEKKRLGERLLVNLVHLKKMEPKDFFIPNSEYEYSLSQFPDLSVGLEAIACAPSSVNKRPTRVFIGENNDRKCLCAKVDDSNKKNLIDLGIAKFNYNYATETVCEWGNGAPLRSLSDL